MSRKSPSEEDLAPFVPHADFAAGLPRGRFHVVVNADLARRFVAQVTRINHVALALIGPGAALALAGHLVAGSVLVALGIMARRLVRGQAGPILLHLAQRNPVVYEQATTHGVMEVRQRD